MYNKRITISIRQDMLEKLDIAARDIHLTRSGYIREAVILKQMIDKMVAMPHGSLRVEELIMLLNHQSSSAIMRSAKRLTWAEVQD